MKDEDEARQLRRARSTTAEKLAAILGTSRSTAYQLQHACDEVIARAEDAGIFAVIAERVWSGQPTEGALALEQAAKELAAQCVRVVEALHVVASSLDTASSSLSDEQLDTDETRARIERVLTARPSRS